MYLYSLKSKQNKISKIKSRNKVSESWLSSKTYFFQDKPTKCPDFLILRMFKISKKYVIMNSNRFV